MRKNSKKLLAMALSVAMIGTTAFAPMDNVAVNAAAQEAVENPVSEEGSSTVSEGAIAADLAVFDNLNSADVESALSPGWNLGNTMEANTMKKVDGEPATYPDETAWSNPKVTKEIFEAVRDAGFKSVRIPVSYLAYVGDKESGYKINEEWLDRVEEVVRMALSTGLYVNTNVHGDGYYTVGSSWLLCGEDAEKQVEIKEKYEAVWTQIAERFADCDEHLIFESMNEEFDGKNGTPNANTKEAYQNIMDYNQIFVDTVRKSGGNNAKRWLMVCGWNTNIDATCDYIGTGENKYRFEMPTDTLLDSSVPEGEGRVMVTCHYYSPWQFCGQEDGEYTQWGEFAVDTSQRWHDGNEDYLLDQFNKLEERFTSQGIPVYIGEYGAIDKMKDDSTSDAYRAYFMNQLCQVSKDTGCIPVYWDQGYNGNHSFYLFNRKTYEITKPTLVEAIMDVYDGDDSEKTAEDILEVFVTKSSATIYKDKDETLDLDTVTYPMNIEDTITWTTSDDTIAKVSDEGVVSCEGTGTVTITAATSNGKTASCEVTVALNPTEIELNHTSLRIDCDTKEKVQMEATLLPLGAVGEVEWSTSDRAIARVNTEGMVTAVTPGECTITATLENGVTATCQVEVYSASAPATEAPSPSPQSTFPAPSGTTTPPSIIPAPVPTADSAPVAGESVKVGKNTYKVTDGEKKSVAFAAAKSNAKSVTVPSSVVIQGVKYSVTSIADGAFKNNKKLTSVVIKAKITNIGKQAFAGCKNLKKITIQSAVLKKVGAKAFKGVHAKCKIFVPAKKYSSYKKLLSGKGQKKSVKIKKK